MPKTLLSCAFCSIFKLNFNENNRFHFFDQNLNRHLVTCTMLFNKEIAIFTPFFILICHFCTANYGIYRSNATILFLLLRIVSFRRFGIKKLSGHSTLHILEFFERTNTESFRDSFLRMKWKIFEKFVIPLATPR